MGLAYGCEVTYRMAAHPILETLHLHGGMFLGGGTDITHLEAGFPNMRSLDIRLTPPIMRFKMTQTIVKLSPSIEELEIGWLPSTADGVDHTPRMELKASATRPRF